jgi:hypothetical protein
VRPGDVVRLGEDDWRYGEGELVLRVERVRDELSRHYGGKWLWLEGHRLVAPDRPGIWMQALVRTAALPPAPITDSPADQGRIHVIGDRTTRTGP